MLASVANRFTMIYPLLLTVFAPEEHNVYRRAIGPIYALQRSAMSITLTLNGKIQMADTYNTQLYIHIVFSVKGRQPLIPQQHKAELHKYINGIVTNKKQKMIQINSMPDHIHILIGITPNIAISDLVRDIKRNATQFINRKRWIVGQFMWQEGFAAFSYSHSQLKDVISYIEKQEKHHSTKTFKEEYLELLKRFDVSYNPKYVFDSDDTEP